MTTQNVTEEAVAKRIVESLIEFGADPDQLRPEATLEELDIDSLDMFELSQILQQEFGLEVNPEDFEGVETLGDAQNVLTGYVKTQANA
ncbi:MAG TPA: phosphopantetheine-binding protein [Thermoleophilaceae bacterium]